MNCKKCGTKVMENANFCMNCGAKIEREIVCRECGMVLPAEARFCMVCGREIHIQNLGLFDECEVEVMRESFVETSQSLLIGMLKTLDPVAFHTEYGRNRVNQTAVNGRWIFCNDVYREGTYIMDENGENKVMLNMGKGYYNLLGMNNKGIWFVDASSASYAWDGETEWWNKIICFNPETNEKKVIRFNAFKEAVNTKSIYIYEDMIYYISEESKNREKLIKLDSSGVETVLFYGNSAEKIERISRMSVDGNRIAFLVTEEGRDGYMDSDEEYRSYWCIMDVYGRNLMIINEELVVSVGASFYLNAPYVKVRQIDLKKNIMWTTLTEHEQKLLHATKYDWVTRELSETLIELHNEKSAAQIYRNVDDTSQILYFDGKDLYGAEHYSRLYRSDIDGNKYEVNGGDGHGEADRILVNDSYVFVSYDALHAVRLPRKFNGFQGYGHKNPEAELIFGEQDYRL